MKSKRQFVLSIILVFFVIGLAGWQGVISWKQINPLSRYGAGAYGQSSDGTGGSGYLAKYGSGGLLTNGPGMVGSDPYVLTAGTVSGTAAIPLCTDSNGGATTSGCPGASNPVHGYGMAFGASDGGPLNSGSTVYVTAPGSCTALSWSITVNAGTATFDIWKLPGAPVDWTNKTAGTVSTSGTAVTGSGTSFPADAAGLNITINSVLYQISSVSSSTSLTLTSSAGSQSGVSYASPGSAIPTVSNSITATNYPSIASGTAITSTSMSSWNTSFIKYDRIAFNLRTASGVTTASIQIECQ